MSHPDDDRIDFPDYEPGQLPEALPREFWAEFDFCGEFMVCHTKRPQMLSGIYAHYTLTTVTEP